MGKITVLISVITSVDRIHLSPTSQRRGKKSLRHSAGRSYLMLFFAFFLLLFFTVFIEGLLSSRLLLLKRRRVPLRLLRQGSFKSHRPSDRHFTDELAVFARNSSRVPRLINVTNWRRLVVVSGISLASSDQ